MQSTVVLGLAILGTLVSVPIPQPWRVQTITSRELIWQSDLIVVATVTAVDRVVVERSKRDHFYSSSSTLVARATVAETWMGAPSAEVRFFVSPTWTCDMTTARLGEQVVLFLTQVEGDDYLHIRHSGRGRLPIVKIDGEQFATLPSAVHWPKFLVYQLEAEDGTRYPHLGKVSELKRHVELELLRLEQFRDC